VTAKGRFARALSAVTAWCRANRHRPVPEQRSHLAAMMRGHYASTTPSRATCDDCNGTPFHTWTEDEIAAYERRWPVGSRERLAFALLLYTGQRVSDGSTMYDTDLGSGRYPRSCR
jgi:hypothetical protein